MPKYAPSPAGAYLASAQTGGGTTSTKIGLGTVDSAYPYSQLASGIIILEAAGPVTVACQAICGASIAITLQVNGATVATGNNATTSTLTYNYVARPGDQVALWETDSGFGGASITAGQTNTFLHVIPAGWPQFTGVPTTHMRANMR